MTKDELRAIYRQERLALSKEDRRERELAIVAQLKKNGLVGMSIFACL
jgi:5-formyltetrahydrofolate cyclo-ligase